MCRHKNKELQIQKVVELANQHYEPGNHARSYKAVWQKFVYPVYPMCYHTFLSYLNASGKRIVTRSD